MVTSVPARITQCKLHMEYAVRLGWQTLYSSSVGKSFTSSAEWNSNITSNFAIIPVHII